MVNARIATRRAGGIPLLVSGYAISSYGNYLNIIALSLFTYEVTRSPIGIGLVMSLRLAAGVCAAPIAGRLAGRLDRRRMMLAADFAQLAAMVVLAVGAAARSVVLLACVVVVLGAGNTTFLVAMRTAVPQLFGQDERVRVTGLLVTVRSLAAVGGFASAGIVIGTGGFEVAFLLNAASFVASAVALVLLGRVIADRGAPGGAAVDAAPGTRIRLLGVVAPAVLAMVVVRGVDALSSSSHNIALPVFAASADPARPATVMALFWSAWALGIVLAHLVLTRWRRIEPGARAFAIGTCVMSVSFALAFVDTTLVLVCASALVAGLAEGFAEITYTARLQAEPDHLRGRLFGLSATAETSGFALGMVASAAALEVAAPAVVVAAFHGLAVAAALAFLVFAVARR